MIFTKQFVAIVCLLLLAACDRYAFTVNEQPVFNPPTLFKDYRIPDQALATCVEQTIADQQITNPRLLQKLHCSHSGIRSLSGLEIFTGLSQVDLSNNELAEIKPLLFLPTLSRVNLQGNPGLLCSDSNQLATQVSDRVLEPDHCRK